MMIGDPTTNQRIQDLTRQLQGTQDPNVAMALQQAMNAQQMQGARNLLYAANSQPTGIDPLTGMSPGDGARQFAQANLQRMQRAFSQNQQGIQQAANSPNPLSALGVPGAAPAGAGGGFRSAYNQSMNPLIAAITGGQ